MSYLVLTRKLGEKVMVGDDVEVCVLEMSGGQVKLGIRAPKHVPVHRLEIWERIQLNGERPRRHVPAVPADQDDAGAEGAA